MVVTQPAARGEIAAVIAGRCWRARHVSTCMRNGLVAVFGADDRGIAVAFAVPLDTGAGVHSVDATAANAVLLAGDEVLTAGATRGSGSIIVCRHTATRLAGSFSLVLAGALPRGREALVSVSGGFFDVPVP